MGRQQLGSCTSCCLAKRHCIVRLCSINQYKCSIELILFVSFPSKLDGCLVTLVHNDSDVDDEESLLLWKQLCYVAHMELHVRGLSSGYCKDVHGQVSRITLLQTHD